MPPFSYDSALRWADGTVKSDIPKQERVYILGPEKVGEIYTLDGWPRLHDVEVGRAVAFAPGLNLAEVLRRIPLDSSQHLTMSVYRASAKSLSDLVFRADVGDKSIATFTIEPRDVVWLIYFDPKAKPKPAT
jgi:hypothetical protein